MEMMEVEKRVFEFIHFAYFRKGVFNNGTMTKEENFKIKCETALNRAYTDMASHTLHLDKKHDGKKEKERDAIKEKTKESAKKVICEKIEELKKAASLTSDAFNKWHKNLCDEIKNIYKTDFDFHIGQSQKWINMTLKYLYVFGEFHDKKEYVECFHAALDNIIIDCAKKKYGIPKPKDEDKEDLAWSKIDDYAVYLNYQNALKGKIAPKSLFDWEFDAWMK